ncbi:type II toxin-antitoxin system VapC family toxin [Rhizobium sp. No.120]
MRIALMDSDIFLLNTTVLSHAEKKKPHPVLVQWLAAQSSLAIPFATFVEVETGIIERQRSNPKRAAELRYWLNDLLQTQFIFPALTPEVAHVLAKMICCRQLTDLWYKDQCDTRKPGQDLSIAAVASVYGFPIASLDGDFERIDHYFPLPGVYNPAFDMWVVPRCDPREANLGHQLVVA